MYTEREYTAELEDTNMKKTTAQKTAAYRLPEATTPENLEMKLMNNLGFQRAQLLRRCVPVHH